MNFSTEPYALADDLQSSAPRIRADYLRLSQMASSAPPNPSAASSSSSTSDPSPFATLPTELKLEILAWTGIASPRALCNLASTNRQLRKLSEPMRWKVSSLGLFVASERR